jgi:GntR family transcriptional regulator, transcriptional repressor for pyruvate dehydrogenase complex
MFTKVRQVRAFESVTRQVESAILQGRFAVGDRLPAERELQGMLDVSRNTLRESLRVLEQKGLVEIRTGNRGGIFVKEPNSDSMTESLGLFVQSQRISMEQISEFRQDLEGLVTRRAALAAGAQDTKAVRRLLAEAARCAAGGVARWEEFMRLDRDIHLALARLAGNPLHHFFLETVHTNYHRCHITTFLPRTAETIRRTLGELTEIVAAVCRGQAEQAERLAREHVRRATAVMQRAGRRAAARQPATPKPGTRPRRAAAPTTGEPS